MIGWFIKSNSRNYNQHCDYDSSTGHYVQGDPVRLSGGTNTYAYVGAIRLTTLIL